MLLVVAPLSIPTIRRSNECASPQRNEINRGADWAYRLWISTRQHIFHFLHRKMIFINRSIRYYIKKCKMILLQKAACLQQTTKSLSFHFLLGSLQDRAHLLRFYAFWLVFYWLKDGFSCRVIYPELTCSLGKMMNTLMMLAPCLMSLINSRFYYNRTFWYLARGREVAVIWTGTWLKTSWMWVNAFFWRW